MLEPVAPKRYRVAYALLGLLQRGDTRQKTTTEPKIRSGAVALEFPFVTRPAHSVGGYLCEGSARPLPL